jgi:hypothetical protein
VDRANERYVCTSKTSPLSGDVREGENSDELFEVDSAVPVERRTSRSRKLVCTLVEVDQFQ